MSENNTLTLKGRIYTYLLSMILLYIFFLIKTIEKIMILSFFTKAKIEKNYKKYIINENKERESQACWRKHYDFNSFFA